MAYTTGVGTNSLGIRGEVVDSIVRQVAARLYKFRQALSESSTNDWSNVFLRENPAILSGPAGNSGIGLPRLANFPQVGTSYEQITVKVLKFARDSTPIPWEDLLAGKIDIQARTIIRVTEGVVKDVDDNIWSILTDGETATYTGAPANIQTVNIGTGRFWNVSSGAILDDIFNAAQQIALKYYSTDNLLCFVSPKDKRYMLKWMTDKGAQWPMLGADIAVNGAFTKFGGVTFIESVSVANSFALVCVPKVCATWRSLVPLQSTIIEEPYRFRKIRVVEEGVVELTDPKAVVLISGTQDGTA